MNSIHVTTTEQTVRWELLFREGDCYDPILIEESERNLRGLSYMSEARIESERLPDGSQRVTVATLDAWALVAGVAFSFDGGVAVTGLSASAKNLFGTGTWAGLFRNVFEERKRVGILGRQPNLFGTRIDATVHGGNTRSGTYFTQSLFRPFTGEVGSNAVRQSAHKRDDFFGYSVEPDLGFTQALLRFEAEQYEVTYQRRFGSSSGTRFVAGLGVSREVIRFPFEAEGGQVVMDSDYSEHVQAPPEVLDVIGKQAQDHATNRVGLTLGVRDLSFGNRVGLDALRASQDVQLGSDLTVTVAPGVPIGDDTSRDLFTRAQGSLGLDVGRLYMLFEGDFQSRHVKSDDSGGATGWRDVLYEVGGTGYWAFSESSTLFGRVLYTAGYSMDRPYQLTLGGRESVRAFNEDAFPGAHRMIATIEQRLPLPGISTGFADFGWAAFADAGKVWAGDVPYGADSDWEAGIGIGLRMGAPAGVQNVFRVDFGMPLTGHREEKGVVIRIYTELFGLLDLRAWPTQTMRSRWHGVDPDLSTRPVNPLAGN